MFHIPKILPTIWGDLAAPSIIRANDEDKSQDEFPGLF